MLLFLSRWLDAVLEVERLAGGFAAALADFAPFDAGFFAAFLTVDLLARVLIALAMMMFSPPPS
jgi:hypothetical protein